MTLCMYIYYYSFLYVVPTPDVSFAPFGPITGEMVGSPQDIHCTVSTVEGVELSAVMISWTGPGGDTITTDSRVTISATISSGNDFISTLQFAYLMEGDEGIYTCSVMILETSASNGIEIINLVGKYSRLLDKLSHGFYLTCDFVAGYKYISVTYSNTTIRKY